MTSRSVAFVGLIVSAALAGCVTREDIRSLQTDIHGLNQGLEARLGNVKDQTDTVQTSQADLLANIQQLTTNLAALQVELEDNRTRMKELSMRLDDLEATLKARMDAQIELLSGSKFVESPQPSTVFNLANADFARGKYAEAARGFETYLKQFPKGEQAPEAKLHIGDILAKQKQDAAAIQAYDDMVQAYPKDSLVPSALLKKADLLQSSGKTAQAMATLESVVKNYARRPEAKTAQDKINSLKNSDQ